MKGGGDGEPVVLEAAARMAMIEEIRKGKEHGDLKHR